jgi:WS/DGAT/MGAT family acyltransferase
MDRLSFTDASFLYIENEFNHMHIAVVALFEGPPPRGDAIEEMIASKLHLVPRYRQKVRFVPFDAGQPVWSDDHHFNLGYHLRHTALPSPGSDEQLRTLVGRVMSQQLDRAKPLWELWVVEGLSEDRWAMLSKTHHCMVDGVAGSDLVSLLMDETADADHPLAKPWEPEPRPTSLSLWTDSIVDGIKSPREGLRALRKAIAAPARLLEGIEEVGDGLSTFRKFTKSEAESSLNGPIGPHRRWHWAATHIAEIKKVRAAHGGTVNDVVLAAITNGFRELMLARGEPVEGMCVRTLVPVSLRREDQHGEFNNRVSAMFAELPMDIADPVERLHSLHAQMSDLKEHHQAAAAETLTSLSGFAPPALLAAGARLFAGIEQHAVQTVTTNVPGPQRPMYAAGRRMLSAYPYVPLAGSVRIGVAIFSYAGNLTFGITGDWDTTADIDVLAKGIESGIADLLAVSQP